MKMECGGMGNQHGFFIQFDSVDEMDDFKIWVGKIFHCLLDSASEFRFQLIECTAKAKESPAIPQQAQGASAPQMPSSCAVCPCVCQHQIFRGTEYCEAKLWRHFTKR